MRVETNQRLIDRNRWWAGRLFLVTIVVMVISFIALNSPLFAQVSMEGPGLLISLILPALLLPVVFILTLFTIRLNNQWVRQPRPEKILVDNLKGLGKSAVLYNFYHFPARHVLVTPAGVIAMVTRWQEGKFTIKGDKWTAHRSAFGRILSALRMDGVGNPSVDAQAAAEKVDQMLADINPDVPVYGAVLFIDPRAEFDATEANLPILHISTKRVPNLKDWVKTLKKDVPQLTPDQITAFEEKTRVQRSE